MASRARRRWAGPCPNHDNRSRYRHELRSSAWMSPEIVKRPVRPLALTTAQYLEEKAMSHSPARGCKCQCGLATMQNGHAVALELLTRHALSRSIDDAGMVSRKDT